MGSRVVTTGCYRQVASTPSPCETPGMAEHSESEPRAKVDQRLGRERAAGVLAGLVRWTGLVFALFLAVHVVFVIGEANQDNGIVAFVRGGADAFSLGFSDLFLPADFKLQVLVNYGLAAIFWLVVSSIVAKVIRRVGGVG